MIDRKAMLEWQAKREKEDRDFREQQRVEDRKWQTRQDWRLAIVAGIFIAIGAIIGNPNGISGVLAIFVKWFSGLVH